MFEIQWPWLLALAPLPLLMMLIPAQKKEEAALRVPFFNRVQHIQTHDHHIRIKNRSRSICLWAIWLLALLAAANPQWIGEPISMPNSGRDLLIAVDISGSMKIEDMKDNGQTINRLIAVKKVVGNFVETRKSDRLGLVLFGTQAYLQAPLTYDRETVNTLLQETEIGFAGENTSIGDAIGLAVKRLRSRPDAQRVLILLTDGANTAGELQPLRAAELAQQEHVKIYTIGFGADEMMIDNGFFGKRRVNPSQDLDEPTMRGIAEKTDGRYFRARNLEELAEIHHELNRLEPIESEQEMFRPVKDLFYWPLALAMLLSFAWPTINILKSRSMSAKGIISAPLSKSGSVPLSKSGVAQ
jgi:Ca-activated chloride channel homolog